jgi:hypothetical protein
VFSNRPSMATAEPFRVEGRRRGGAWECRRALKVARWGGEGVREAGEAPVRQGMRRGRPGMGATEGRGRS